MKVELKKAIINYIFENLNQFQLTNNVVQEFRPYIYSPKGGYLIGGKEVLDFIVASIELITTN